MKRASALLLCIALSACSLPQPPKSVWDSLPQAVSSNSAASLPPVPKVVHEESGRSFSSVPKTTTGSMLERAADGGILEIGVDEAPVLTIFTNYSCDYCSQFMSRDFARLLREYVDIGRLKVRIVSVPLAKYKTSDGEAAALFCATSKARGKQMHDKLLATAKRDRAGLLALGTAVKLTTKEFGACMDAQTTKDQLAIQKTMIETNGITLVPSFMLGSAIQTGYPAYADLRGWIDAQLQ